MSGHNHHIHDESCGCSSCDSAPEAGSIRVESQTHDGAVVVSGALTVFGQYASARAALESELVSLGKAVTARGGIIGHIKASAAVTAFEMFSLTDTDVSVKQAPMPEVRLNVTVIVFAVPEEPVQRLVRQALETIGESYG